ncbi:MAG: flagellar basal body-associated FliL family protein [Dehalococcoidia bacterium]
MNKKLLMIGAPVGGLVVVAALFFFVGLPGGSEEPLLDESGEPVVEVEEPAEDEFVAVRVEGKLGPYLKMTDRVFTLLSSIDTPRYLKLEVVLVFETDDEGWFELAGEALEEALEVFHEEMPVLLIEDAITTAVSAKTVLDISTREGKDQLREEIRLAIAALLPEEHIYGVLFTNFITQ